MHIRSLRSVGLAALTAVSLALVPSPARAAGFAIFEQGAKGMGFAGAFTAQADDPSAIFHNAAGVAFLKGKQVYLGGTLIAPSADFTGADPFPGTATTEQGDAGITIPPAFDYTHQLSEQLVVGFGVHVPYGLATQWQNRDTSFSGRFISKHAELRSFAFNPTVAYKLADRFAVGAGLDIRISSVTLERDAAAVNPYTLKPVSVAAVNLESDTNTGIGFNVGVLAKLTEDLSFGVSYRHKVKIDYTGSATFTPKPTGNASFDALAAQSLPAGATPVETAIEFPAIFSAGVAYNYEDWTVEADVNWYQWSTFGTLPLTFTEHPELNSTVEENYNNSMQYRIGIERRLSDSFAVRGGYFYDESPAPVESVSPLLPDANRHGACLGLSWKTGSFRVDVANWYLFFNERSTEGKNRDNYNGTYDSSAELFAVSLGYSF